MTAVQTGSPQMWIRRLARLATSSRCCVRQGRQCIHECVEHLVVTWVERIDPPCVVAARADPWQYLSAGDE